MRGDISMTMTLPILMDRDSKLPRGGDVLTGAPTGGDVRDKILGGVYDESVTSGDPIGE
jgi:hypothetical protein